MSQCNDRQLKFLDRIKMYREQTPKWFQIFLEDSYTLKPIQCGSYKIVYPYKDYAISIEQGDKRMRSNLLNTLKLMPKQYQKHLIYPLESFFVDNFTVSKLSLCPHGDLYEIFFEKKLRYSNGNLTLNHFVDLAATLDALHNKNIAVVDIKPENIMMCTCNCLAFIDLDSAISFSETKKLKAATPWWDPILVINRSRREPRDFFISDWASFALVTLHYVALYRWSKERPVLYNLLRTSSDENDYTYSYLEYQIIEEMEGNTFTIKLENLVRAAMNLLNNLFVDPDAQQKNFSPTAGKNIITFQNALGLSRLSAINNGRFRLENNNSLKF